ncbi:mannose-1-phosphate guanylyltransferase/mannose-6-phosphate isomerase [Denitromonas iodatirespirans]|uniref:mannose-1-phosphate guanylyltransferase n=1 Tax=Denitromonas iodatirespirans TaxID=2795389 RepID=A0A944DER4_DENI1|nr:mannose-1-phosphate guanylyltransferase/mannose-6-phosphate isomerase [Denitromonas iodatirespirans]MBT0963646.1 mannose-1-phosphate guanylyltransferase/mannose-6-phosphate isomerase [Denitromonas iodatirespirans]
MQLQPVILSGGSGTRLWPLSREQYPKQLLALAGAETMLQATALRLDGLSGECTVAERPMVVCNEDYRFMTAEQLRAIGKASDRIILEPAGRNTAPALTLAALAAIADGEDPLLLVMPADHVIGEREAFQQAVVVGARMAAQGAMVSFGIVPERAETGYGYIRCGADYAEGVRMIAEFVEKPDVSTAERYLASGDYLWNSGIFLVRAGVWLRAMAQLQPEILNACESAMRGCRRDSDFIRVDAQAFAACPSDSIDYAVMEHLPTRADVGIPGVVVPLAAAWSDLGAWDALWQIAEKDGQGNVGQGDVLFEDVHGTLAIATDRMVACVGVRDLVVVETPDAVMVLDKSRTQDVKKIVARLKAELRPQASAHRKIQRPWGYYDSIDSGDRFQVKRIVVNPGASLSLQMHHHRAEHWIVVTGTARVTRGDETFLLSENQSTYIPLGTTHRLENPGRLPLEMIEVQSGSYLGEDDIVRFEDSYGRQ